MRARALMFFFLSVASGKFAATHVGINPSLREWQKSIAFLVTTAKTEDAKLTFKIISSRRNRPPNSRSSRLFPANSRTAPSPRYALSERFESFFLYHKKSSHNEKRRGENERLIAISDNVEFLSRLSLSLVSLLEQRARIPMNGGRKALFCLATFLRVVALVSSTT